MNNKILLLIIGSQMKSFGLTLEHLDENTTGKDDLAGVLLDAGADVVNGFALNSNDPKIRRAVQAIHDATGAYLTATA